MVRRGGVGRGRAGRRFRGRNFPPLYISLERDSPPPRRIFRRLQFDYDSIMIRLRLDYDPMKIRFSIILTFD